MPDVFDRIDTSRRYLGAADVSRGGGEVKEYTGKRLTKVTRIAGRPEVRDEILPGITSKAVENRATELWEAAGRVTPDRFPDDIDEHWINAKLELMEEKVAEKNNVSPEEVEGYVNDYMFITDDDPESLLAGMVSGTHQYKQKPKFHSLTDEIMRTYTNQGYSKQEIRRLYNEKKEVFNAQWDRISKQSSIPEKRQPLRRFLLAPR